MGLSVLSNIPLHEKNLIFGHTMKTIHILLIFLIPFLTNTTGFAQYQGIYTVGDSTADFMNMDSVYLAFRDSTTQGQITLEFKPGIYPSLNLFIDSLTIRPESKDTMDVYFVGYGLSSAISISGSHVVVDRIIMYSEAIDRKQCTLYLSQAMSSVVSNCIIKSNDSVQDHQASCIFVKGSNYDSNPPKLTNNVLLGNGYGITIEGRSGLICSGNKVFNKGLYSLRSDYHTTLLEVYDNTFLSQIDLSVSYNGKIYFGRNIAYHNVDIENLDTLQFCSFRDTLERENLEIDISTPYILNNFIGSSFELQDFNPRLIQGNEFHGTGDFTNYVHTLIEGNITYGSLEFSRGPCTFTNNKLYGGLYFSFSTKVYVYNNIVGGNVSNGFSDLFMFNNNCEETLKLGYGHGDFKAYNNLFRTNPDYGFLFHDFSHNNYYPVGGDRDKHPYNYDPMYNAQGYATNPLLIEKGKHIPQVLIDFDSTIRPYTPTLGIHELCVSKSLNGREMKINCGDQFVLNSCGNGNQSNWQPSSTVTIDTANNKTTFKPNKTTTYRLLDTIQNVIDSFHLVIEHFKPNKITSDSSLCHETVIITLGFTPGATYTWTPTTYLFDSTNHYTFRTWPDSSITYSYRIEIPGCDTITDEFTYYVDPKPILAYPIDISHYGLSTYYFQAHYYCYDSLIWHFGDGDTAHGYTAQHEYSRTKDSLYNGYVVAYHLSATDTAFFNVNSKPLSHNFVSTNKDWAIYPNPVINELTIADLRGDCTSKQIATISNNIGEVVLRETLSSGETKIPINLPSGVYFIAIDGCKNRVLMNIMIIK